jgi:hypothetical protein
VAVGLGLFLLAGGLLYLTNLARFGNGFEFGHRLNVQQLYGSLYATRFDHPFQQEPLASAARELFGWLFLDPKFNDSDYYRERFVPGQSATLRWREAYLTTYDLSYLAMILAGGAAGAAAGWRLWRGRREVRRAKSEVRSRDEGLEDNSANAAPDSPASPPPDSSAAKAGADSGLRTSDFGLPAESAPTCPNALDSPLVVAALALYAALATALLLGFYLRNGVMATRYLLDLMPAFAAAILAAWLAWGGFCQRRRKPAAWWMGVSLLLLAGWWGWQISRSRSDYGPPRVFTWADVQERQKRTAAKGSVFPRAGAYQDPQAPGKTGVPYNGVGWATNSGRLMPCVILFVDNPAFLELDLAAEVGSPVAADPKHIRAKVGLEYLQREQVERTDAGWKVRLHGPRQRRYQRGVQPVFLATVPNRHLADYQHAPWRLVQVRWRADAAAPL